MMEQALPIKGETQPAKKILPGLPGFIPTCWLSSGLQFFSRMALATSALLPEDHSAFHSNHEG